MVNVENATEKEAVVLLEPSPTTKPKDTNSARSGYLSQILISAVAITGGISTGLILGFSSIALPQLTKDPDSNEIYLNPDQASWFASLTTIASPLGCLLCGPISDRFGRKFSLVLLHLPALLGWTLLVTASPASPHPLGQLYCGRVLLGLSVGMSSIPATIYLAEIASDPRLRSLLMPWTSVSITLGILLVYVLGALLRDSWQIVAAICAVLPLAAVGLTCVLVPESPPWLLASHQPGRALQSLRILRGARGKQQVPGRVQAEYDALVAAQDEKDREANGNDASLRKSSRNPLRNYYVSTCETLRMLGRPEALRPLFIMHGLFFFQQFSGYIVITYYAVDLLLTAGVAVDPFLATILLGVVQFVSGVAVSWVLTRCGRRPMNITGGAGMAVCMIGLGLNMQYRWLGSWFPLTALTAIVIFSMVGFRTVPWTLLGEIYPLPVRGVAVGLTTCNMYIFSFTTVKLYPLLAGWLHSAQAVFYLYGAASLLGTLFVVFCQPETRNKTLDQIQAELNGHERKRIATGV